MTKEQVELLRDVLFLAYRDIGEWMQLGKRWQDESPDYSRDPKCPTDAGMEASNRARWQIGEALKVLRTIADASDVTEALERAGERDGKGRAE